MEDSKTPGRMLNRNSENRYSSIAS
jgi:hypothetical protein